MGGFITLRSLIVDQRIKVAASVIASPYWADFPQDVACLDTPQQIQQLQAYAARYQPANCLQKFFPTALLIQNGEEDQHVDASTLQKFYTTLQPYYQQEPERLKLHIFPDTAHDFTAPMWTNTLNLPDYQGEKKL